MNHATSSAPNPIRSHPGSQPIEPRELKNPLSRAKKIYGIFATAMTAVILLIFFEPTANRLVHGAWKRDSIEYVWTLSLDVHALVSYAFLFLFLGQAILGAVQDRSARLRVIHKRLGYLLFYGLIPVFLLGGAWVLLDRAYNIPQEESMIFTQDRAMVVSLVLTIVVFVAWFIVRSYRAVKKGDVLAHLDNIFGAYMFIGGIAFFRLLFAIIWLAFSISPLSFAGMFFVTGALQVAMLAIAFRWAGRLKDNRTPLIAYVVVNVLFAALGAGHYSFLSHAY